VSLVNLLCFFFLLFPPCVWVYPQSLGSTELKTRGYKVIKTNGLFKYEKSDKFGFTSVVVICCTNNRQYILQLLVYKRNFLRRHTVGRMRWKSFEKNVFSFFFQSIRAPTHTHTHMRRSFVTTLGR
jgi:hypothetical protein